MPTMASITVKNVADADVVYVPKVASAGDRSPARWTQDASSTIPAFRPSFVVGAKSDSSGKRRIIDLNYAYPSLQEISGVQQLVDKLTFQGTFSFSTYGPETLSAEMVKQLGGLIASTLIQEVVSSGYAPTA